jgi:hypothetical protein
MAEIICKICYEEQCDSEHSCTWCSNKNVLTWDQWDGYGYKTDVCVHCVIGCWVVNEETKQIVLNAVDKASSEIKNKKDE